MNQTTEEKILDKIDHALSAVRQSVPESLSPILQEIRSKIENNGVALEDYKREHGIEIKAIREQIKNLAISVQPAVDALDTAGKVRKYTINIAGFILAFGAIIAVFEGAREWWKH